MTPFGLVTGRLGNIQAMDFRIERDSLGDVQVPAGAYWGSQAERSRQLFKISWST